MNQSTLLAAAFGGILAGACASEAPTPAAPDAPAATSASAPGAPMGDMTMASTTAAAGDKHACKGLNNCKGQGGCKSPKVM